MPIAQTIDCTTELPTIEWLGEGGVTFELGDFDTFVVKRIPFRFDLEAGEIDGSGATLYRARSSERVWRCQGNCALVAVAESPFALGAAPVGTTFEVVVIDDDGRDQQDDQRRNWWALNDPTIPYALVNNQEMVEYLALTVPERGTWYYYAADSIGIAATCQLAPADTATPTQTTTPTGVPSATVTAIATATVTVTATPLPPTQTTTSTPTATDTPVRAPTTTDTATPLPPPHTATSTPTATPTNTATGTPASTSTNTPFSTPTATSAPPTNTPTHTPTTTPTDTPLAPTATTTPSLTPTATSVPPTQTPTPTAIPTATAVSSSNGVLYISASESMGTVNGLAYQDEDILAFDLATETFSIFFDGSDVGSSYDISAFHLENDGTLLFSTLSPVTLSGVGFVDRGDIIRFTPTSLGEATAGKFSWVLDGSDVGLEAISENIDAIGRAPDGRLVVSTFGGYELPGLSGSDADLLIFTATTLGTTTSGSWELYFDGSDVGMNTGLEDIWSVWIDGDSAAIYLSFFGEFSVTGTNPISGDHNDIIICTPVTTGETTSCAFAPFWDGDAYGFTDTIDAVSRGNTLPSSTGGGDTREELLLKNKIYLPMVER